MQGSSDVVSCKQAIVESVFSEKPITRSSGFLRNLFFALNEAGSVACVLFPFVAQNLHSSGCVGAMDFSLQNIVGEGSVFVVDDHYDVAVA